MPIVVDSRGVSTYISDDQARAAAEELVERATRTLDVQDSRGYPLNDADAARVEGDLVEAQRLLEDIGELKSRSVRELSRFVQPGWAEQELAARADAEERRRAEVQRVVEVALMVDQLGEPGDPHESEPKIEVDPNESPPERVNVKHVPGQFGSEQWLVSGRGPEAKYADMATAEREARRRVGRA
jgi:peptidoglycan/xylan/chitin deacetylase (PgdA/CDA1 family)